MIQSTNFISDFNPIFILFLVEGHEKMYGQDWKDGWPVWFKKLQKEWIKKEGLSIHPGLSIYILPNWKNERRMDGELTNELLY